MQAGRTKKRGGGGEKTEGGKQTLTTVACKAEEREEKVVVGRGKQIKVQKIYILIIPGLFTSSRANPVFGVLNSPEYLPGLGDRRGFLKSGCLETLYCTVRTREGRERAASGLK